MTVNELGEPIGGEAEKGPELEAQCTPADPVALGLALQSGDPTVNRSLISYLDEQRALIGLQLKHFDEEHRLSIGAAKRKRVLDVCRIGFQAFVGFGAVILLTAAIWMFWDASTDHGIRVEAFAVPPDLREKGLTGEVVAQKVLDCIADMDRNSTSSRAPSSYAHNWGSDLKVEIPETGISFAEVSRWIHRQLGHATYVDGAIYHTDTGVVVAAHAGPESAIEASGSEKDIAGVIQQAAIKLYAATQPYRYAVWLGGSQKQIEESNAVLRRLAAEGDQIDRLWALNGLTWNLYVQSAPSREVEAQAQRAFAIDPHFLPGMFVLAGAALASHPQIALQYFERLLSDPLSGHYPTYSSWAQNVALGVAKEKSAALLGDYLAATVAATDESKREDEPAWARENVRLSKITYALSLHDLRGAEAMANMLPPSNVDYGEDARWVLSARLAAAREDWNSALSIIDQAITKEKSFNTDFWRVETVFATDLYVHAGRDAEALTQFVKLEADDYGALRSRALMALRHRQFTDGIQALQAAVQADPRIPFAYKGIGDVYVAMGRWEEAATYYRIAHERGPHWADPLKAWGDLLSKRGQTALASAKYREALMYAPRWRELREATRSN